MDEPESEKRVEVEREPPRVERETTIVTSNGGGGGGAVAAIVILLLVALVAFLYFGGYLTEVAEETDINVNVDVPQVDVPDVDINVPPPSQPTNTGQ